MKATLKPHQRKAVEELANGKILHGGTGVGKGITALAYFYEKVCGGDLAHIPSMKKPRDLYILTTKKKRDEKDWEADAVKLGLGTHDDSLDGIKVTVDTWNNIKKYAGVKDAFFIFDEQRVVGSGAWSRTFISLAKHNQWLLLSATPGDTWLDYIPVFVANGWYKNRTEFKQRHVVYNTFSKFPKVDRYIETGTLVRHRNNVLVHMPYERHTKRILHTRIVQYDTELFELVKEKRWHPYEERPIRDVAELFAVMRKVVNSDESRLDSVRMLMQEHPRLIVFYNFNYELEMLRKLGSSSSKSDPWSGTIFEQNYPFESPASTITMTKAKYEFEKAQRSSSASVSAGPTADTPATIVAEWNGHKHDPVPDSDRWVYLVQYTAGSEGWNCIDTDATCFYSLTYSYKHWHQAHGRIDRMNTRFTDLHYYKLMSNSFIDQAVWRSLKVKRSFNESSQGLWVPEMAA